MRNEKGMVLIVTLMILVIITAMVVEFSQGVYTTMSSLNNWKESQRLSLIASSAVTLTVKNISDHAGAHAYTYLAEAEIPINDILPGFKGNVMIRIEDENSKFNLNSLILPNGKQNDRAWRSFKKLLGYLKLDDNLAEIISDWIDKDIAPRQAGGESGAKNAYLDTVDELLLIRGIDHKIYERLQPFVTVYGIGQIGSDLVNINTVSVPVLMALGEGITKEMAERVVTRRNLSPFEKTSDVVRVAGFEGPAGQSIMDRILVKSANFRFISRVEENRIRKVIECVVEIAKGRQVVKYWKEM